VVAPPRRPPHHYRNLPGFWKKDEHLEGVLESEKREKRERRVRVRERNVCDK
jgi:hypothetical protein